MRCAGLRCDAMPGQQLLRLGDRKQPVLRSSAYSLRCVRVYAAPLFVTQRELEQCLQRRGLVVEQQPLQKTIVAAARCTVTGCVLRLARLGSARLGCAVQCCAPTHMCRCVAGECCQSLGRRDAHLQTQPCSMQREIRHAAATYHSTQRHDATTNVRRPLHCAALRCAALHCAALRQTNKPQLTVRCETAQIRRRGGPSRRASAAVLWHYASPCAVPHARTRQAVMLDHSQYTAAHQP